MKTLNKRIRPLTLAEVQEFFDEHLPYRQTLLTTHKLITADQPHFQTLLPNELRHKINVSSVEASLISSRMFMEFLGLGIKYNPRRLVQNRKYFAAEDGNSYEVKIIDLGGQWVDINKLAAQEQDLLARLYLTGHRATAHLTHNAPYGGEWRIIHNGVTLIGRLLKENLYDIVGQAVKAQ